MVEVLPSKRLTLASLILARYSRCYQEGNSCSCHSLQRRLQESAIVFLLSSGIAKPTASLGRSGRF